MAASLRRMAGRREVRIRVAIRQRVAGSSSEQLDAAGGKCSDWSEEHDHEHVLAILTVFLKAITQGKASESGKRAWIEGVPKPRVWTIVAPSPIPRGCRTTACPPRFPYPS